MKWEERTEVQKGNLGEAIIDNYLRNKNLIPYVAVFDGAHPFDRLVASANKKSIYIAEIKTKARRTYYPDTGINYRNYCQYKHIAKKYGIKIFVFFVDEWAKGIYGNILENLEEPKEVIYKTKKLNYPLRQGEIIYFPLCNTKNISSFNEADAEKLKGLAKRNYDYPSST
jgi:hypothetical protein